MRTISSPSPFVAYAFDQLEGAAPSASAPAGPAPELIAEQARAAGRADGLAAGRAEALEALAPALQAVEAAAAALEAERARSSADLEVAAVDLALRIAERVLAGAVQAEPERVLDVIRGALRSIVERERITILVSPEDLDLVRGASDALAGEMGGIARLDVQAERRVGRGGAILMTPAGEVDGSLATKLERVREVLAAELQRA